MLHFDALESSADAGMDAVLKLGLVQGRTALNLQAARSRPVCVFHPDSYLASLSLLICIFADGPSALQRSSARALPAFYLCCVAGAIF